MATTLWRTWEQTAAAGQEAVAIIDAVDGRTWTRTALSQWAREIADTAPTTARAGQAVAFALGNGGDWMAFFLAAQRRGMVALALDLALPRAGRGEAARRLGAHWIWSAADGWTPLTQDEAPWAGAEDACVLKTTSGTTGEPRALMFRSEQMLADGRQVAQTMGITPEDRNLGAIPFGHSYGLGNVVLPLILQGTSVVASAEILPGGLVEQIERYEATVLPSVPAVLRGLAEASVAPGRLRTLRRVISAGAPLRAEVAAAFRARFGAPVQNFYGSSETGGICFDRTGEATETGRSVGTPLEGVELRLDDSGQVSVRSAAVVDPGEWTLADLGEWNALGELTLKGRTAVWANIGGKKVAPGEVERALREVAGVTDAWVGVHTRTAGEGEYLVAAVETRQDRAEVQAALAERLPAWQMPRRWWLAESLPRTARGKLDCRKLERRLSGGE